MPTIRFTKMHGLGNDFMLIDGRQQKIDANALPIRQWADRHTGIGFDQLLLLLPSDKANVFCRIFNTDGSEAEQCGNGMRCVARFLRENGQISIETRCGIVNAIIHDNQHIEVTMGVPLLIPGWHELQILSLSSKLRIFALSIGNPHAILRVDSLNQFPVRVMGEEIATHQDFPLGVNAGFMQVLDAHTIRLKTFERGVGETLACGSNACAAVVAGILHDDLVSPVTVQLPLGSLEIAWDGEGHPVRMTGAAIQSFSGELLF